MSCVQHEKQLEGLYHDAFLNKCLGDSWKEGQKWAITDINGIQMCDERCLQFDDQFQKVQSCALHLRPQECEALSGGSMISECNLCRIVCF